MTNQYKPDHVSAPAETIREILDDRGMKEADLDIGALSNLVITKQIAQQLEKVLGVPASFWLAREANYCAYLSQQQLHLPTQ